MPAFEQHPGGDRRANEAVAAPRRGNLNHMEALKLEGAGILLGDFVWSGRQDLGQTTPGRPSLHQNRNRASKPLLLKAPCSRDEWTGDDIHKENGSAVCKED